MSERAEVQHAIYEHLLEHADYWTAPYGVIEDMITLAKGNGKVRIITFGVSAYLDASIWIWRENDITVKGVGPLAYAVEGTYDSKEDLFERFDSLYNMNRTPHTEGE